MWSTLLNGILSGVIAAASVGVVDLIEYVAFNPAVFYVHNFPDIVPDIPQGKFAAFWSGYRVSWFIYVPERILLACIGLHLPGIAHLCFPLCCLLFMIFDRATVQHIKRNAFYYHKWFYLCGAACEVGWILGFLLK